MGARSKGCRICKLRRVKCDETHPSCRRCSRAGLACKGYDSELKFIDENSRIEHCHTVIRMQEQEYGLQKKSQQLYHSGHLPTLSAKPSSGISLVGFQEEMMISFLVSKLLQGRSHCNQLPLGSTKGPPLILILPRVRVVWIGDTAKVSHKSLIALAAQWFGPAHGLPGMTMKSLQLYGQALSDVRSSLLKPESVLEFDIFASLTLFCMFELTTYSTESGWIKHAEALERLMETRGPDKQKHNPEKSMFLEQRIIIVSKSLLEQKRTILSQPSWKTVPWEDNPSAKEPFEYLIDILCDVAGHLEDMKAITNQQEIVSRELLAERVALSLNELDNWWSGWIAANPQACDEIQSTSDSTVMVDDDGPLFPTILRYSSLSVAYLVCTHNCGRILLLYVQRCLGILAVDRPSANNESGISDNTTTQPLLGICSNSISLAHEVLRSLDYCFEQAGGFMGSLCVMVLQNEKYGALDPVSREAAWLRRKDMT